MHGMSHCILLLLSLHGCSIHCYLMFTYHCYTCIYDIFSLVTWISIPITCIIVPWYRIHVICLFPVTDIVIPVTGYMFPVTDTDVPDTGYESCWYAICGLPHLLFPFPVILILLYCSRFPLYGSMLSTELRSSYHDTRIMYCIYSCYLVYLTYQIIKITWVWGRLDGWLDHIGWMFGSIVRPTAGDGVVLATVCYSRYMLQL